MALLEMLLVNNLLRKLWNTAFVLVQDFAVHSLVSRVNERYTYNYKLRRSFFRHLKRNKETTSVYKASVVGYHGIFLSTEPGSGGTPLAHDTAMPLIGRIS
jgi:hypothetical protein